jgi:hypothetical protein
LGRSWPKSELKDHRRRRKVGVAVLVVVVVVVVVKDYITVK